MVDKLQGPAVCFAESSHGRRECPDSGLLASLSETLLLWLLSNYQRNVAER